MKRLVLAIVSASCMLVPCLATPVALAQPDAGGVLPDTVSIEFKGGSFSDYIAALKKTGKPINVVASERASKQALAPISLNQVSVGVAVFAIQAASTSPSGAWRIDVISIPGPRTTQPGHGEAYSVDFYPFGKRGEDVIVESFSLQRILQDAKSGLDAKVILTAIETGLKLQNDPGEQPADLQFHQDSGLLFVRGSSADVRLVGSIVGRMAEDSKSRSATFERRAAEEAMRSIAIKEAKLEVQFQTEELAAVTRAFEMSKALADKGNVPQSELSQFEMEVARARFKLEKAKLGLERAQITPIFGDSEPGQPAPPPVPVPPNAARSTPK